LRITLILAACRFALDGVAERVEAGDVLRAVALTDYFKEQARRVFGALGGQDPRNRLMEDCARFVSERGGSWKGTATDLHEQLASNHKPDRPNELSKFLKEAADYEPGFSYGSETERFKGEGGEWKSRRVLALSIRKR
jgi:hypothetical protein